MLIREIVTEARSPRKPSEAALTQAETAGFDISKLWFHGTRKRFDGFQFPKERGIDELGPGVYLTSVKWLANTWARERGFILICAIRKGPLFNLENMQKTAPQMRQLYVQNALDKWVGEKPDDAAEFSGESFDRNFARDPHRTANHFLSLMGYIGGFNNNSQIRGQVVVFKPEDVMIVARQGGKRYMTSDDE